MRANDLFPKKSIIEDLNGDRLVITPDSQNNQVTLAALFLEGSIDATQVKYQFNQSHIPQFLELIDLLKEACTHEREVWIETHGTNERLTVCEDCGKAL